MSFSATEDYNIIADLGTFSASTHLWLAEQKSITRRVLLVELTDLSARETFLADARAKASVDHPLIASIYEAHDLPHACFYTAEYLAGKNLTHFLPQKETLTPAQLALLLTQTAKAAAYYKEKNIATSALEISHIYFDSSDIIRIENLACTESLVTEKQDIVNLGKTLPPLVRKEVPGTSRMLNLLHWMKGNDEANPINTWADVIHYSSQIESQLAPEISFITAQQTQQLYEEKKSHKKHFATLFFITAAIISSIFCYPKLRTAQAQRQQAKAEQAKQNQIIPPQEIPANPQFKTKTFWLAAQPVTIEKYAAFLEQLELLEKEKQTLFNHPSQPPEKKNHIPQNWQAILTAAKNHGTYLGEAIHLKSPIIEIDWWDAYAYADWNNGKLPSAEEVQAILSLKNAASYLSTFSEWCGTETINPSNPAAGTHHLIYSLTKREYTDDLSQRNNQLTFRVRYDEQKTNP